MQSIVASGPLHLLFSQSGTLFLYIVRSLNTSGSLLKGPSWLYFSPWYISPPDFACILLIFLFLPLGCLLHENGDLACFIDCCSWVFRTHRAHSRASVNMCWGCERCRPQTRMFQAVMVRVVHSLLLSPLLCARH